MIDRFSQFCTSIASIQRSILKIERTEMAKYGLKGPHANCLVAMARFPEGITAARLCEVCEKDKAAVSRTLAELEEGGMIYRENRNGSRYRSALMLTEQGEIAAEAVVEKARMAVERAGIGFGESDREVFYRVLAIIAGNLHKLCKEGLTRNHESCV